ncbi:hypothetical protein DFP72DRAFT_844351 [Ephemerocybe angulata]|uniref:Uncharacterized protein n=1 Tax=Ephemerocybe angulata TaxID=980116 RepID=A0A8H6M987_9AGAR|nr:hypothetical protein DFP72DRAFT_844351 [Tulosesus angulatus]
MAFCTSNQRATRQVRESIANTSSRQTIIEESPSTSSCSGFAGNRLGLVKRTPRNSARRLSARRQKATATASQNPSSEIPDNWRYVSLITEAVVRLIHITVLDTLDGGTLRSLCANCNESMDFSRFPIRLSIGWSAAKFSSASVMNRDSGCETGSEKGERVWCQGGMERYNRRDVRSKQILSAQRLSHSGLVSRISPPSTCDPAHSSGLTSDGDVGGFNRLFVEPYHSAGQTMLITIWRGISHLTNCRWQYSEDHEGYHFTLRRIERLRDVAVSPFSDDNIIHFNQESIHSANTLQQCHNVDPIPDGGREGLAVYSYAERDTVRSTWWRNGISLHSVCQLGCGVIPVSQMRVCFHQSGIHAGSWYKKQSQAVQVNQLTAPFQGMPSTGDTDIQLKCSALCILEKLLTRASTLRTPLLPRFTWNTHPEKEGFGSARLSLEGVYLLSSAGVRAWHECKDIWRSSILHIADRLPNTWNFPTSFLYSARWGVKNHRYHI